MGDPQVVHEMARMVNKYNPQMLFLIETKRKSLEMEWLKSKWCFDNCLAVDSIGRGGGLALLWMNEASVEILSFSHQHIDAKISGSDSAQDWRFTGFYGSPKTSLRGRSWDMLRQLNNNILPWLCAGDFNEI